MRRWWVRLLLALVVVVLLLIGGVLLITNTDWGRERVRRYVEGLIQRNSHGLVHIGGVTGNLLRGFTLHDVVITDSAHRPFVKVDEAWARYSLTTLRGKRIDFREVKLVRPVIVIDKLPGDKWNYERIFPRDTTTSTGPKKTGWGTWIRFSDVTMIEGDLTIRAPWAPDPNITPAEQQDAVRRALGPTGRLKIIQLAKGYQRESSFHHINAIFPLVRLEDPAYKTHLVDVAALRMIAEPFRPPVADVRGLTGTFQFTSDSLWWKGARVAFPQTKASGDGKYLLTNGDLHLRLHGDPVNPADLRWAWVNLPEGGSGKLDFGLDWTGSKSVYLVQNMDMTIQRSHIAGQIEATVTDTVAYRNADLRFANLETRLITQLFPTMTFPRPLTLTGSAKFNGGEHALAVNGDVVVDDRLSGRSHIVAVGVMGLAGGVFTARDLRTRMLPLQTGLMKAIAPKLFLNGTLSGNATLNGSSAGIMTAVGDVTNVDRGAVSRATGRFAFRPRGLLWVDVDARMHPLSLVTFGRIAAPTLGLHGNASGPLKVRGDLGNLAINTQMTIAGGGFVDVRGTMDLQSTVTGYNLNFNTRELNANAIVAKAPSTSVTAVGSFKGRGFDPATMQAELVADVAASRIDTVSIDSANVRVALANGLATFDTLAVGVPQGIVEAKGTFGLTAGRTGTLSYHVAIDSLENFAGLISKDTGVVQPRPGILARRVAKAKSDSSRLARATVVERAITGRTIPPTVVDTPTAIPKNILSGSVRADGVATGNIKNFSLRGTASGTNVIAQGNSVGSFTADYDWVNARTPQSQVRVNAEARAVRAAGFDLDSVGVKLTYHKPNGTLNLVVNQDNSRTYAADAAFTLDKVRNELTLNNLRLQMDTSVWASTHAAALHWGQAGVDVQNLELRNGANGRIYVNGFVPKQGSANLDIAVDNVDVGDVIALTESDINASGLVSFNVHATGTLGNPQFKGAFGATDLVYNGTVMPEVHGNIEYANQTLSGRAEAMRAGLPPFLVAEGTVPINLALTGVTGSRFPSDRQIALNVTADSLPLDMVPQLQGYVANLKGKVATNFKVAGTLNHPQVTGQFTLHEGQAKVVLAGITLNQIEASVRLMGDTIVVDSVVAYNNGRIAITGGIGLKSLTAPSFDLKLKANAAQVLKNDRGNLTASANLAMVGPFKDAHVTGDVRIMDGVLYIPPPENKNLVGAGDPALFSVIDTAVMADKEIFPSQNPLLANLRMDVELRVDRDVFVRSREANVEVYTEVPMGVHVNRAKESLVIDGVLLTERGEYTFMTRRFNIKRGSATFINSTELNPTLQGVAEYEVREPNREAINIQIVVGGTLSSPNISLTSDAQPPITQSDLLSYLAFGRSSSSLLQLEGSGLTNGGGSENVVGRGAALASRQLAGVALGVLADQVAGSAARSLGADVFTITPADVQTDVGDFLRATQFEFGKYIKSHTFVAIKSPLDPAALQRPGIQVVHRFGGLRGYRLETGVDTRYLLREPTLSRDQNIGTTSAFGAFLIREWRF
ncbi:MAG TPA: translocation/assembly module TamB domain-containing protein [Gemmatimonadaceae bacterium]|jgi:translocation and assembly module TamB|nr:translocation/assembly module TamB domain-containing protein [Gemmatimonadaceae bacterium]